jgi:hypothetical protein
MQTLQLAVGFLIFGAILEILVFIVLFQKKQGFGANTIKIIGIIAVVTITGAIVTSEVENIEPAMAILGAVAGYLFGFSEKKTSDE